MPKTLRYVVASVGVVILCGLTIHADGPTRLPDQLVAEFSRSWDAKAWVQKPAFRPNGYMWPSENAGWQTRMSTLQGLVVAGRKSVPVLIHVLKNGTPPSRVLAAQALGYLPPNKATPIALLKAAKSDKEPAVRLYAVDSLGMHGVTADVANWKSLKKSESNGDVKKHINYAIERDGKPLDPSVINTFKNWDTKSVNSATVGKPAPDFKLTTATGETIRLSQFRGKKAIVLVFVYGDT